MNWKKTFLICILILLLGAGATAVIFFTEPKAVRETATKETAMLVEVAAVKRGTYRPTIVAMGSVAPEQEIILSPRIRGEVVARAPAFTPGGRVAEGETLLRIDPADYRNTLQERQSALERAVADLNIEMGRQDVALQDYRILDEELADEKKSLVLRTPQLKTARAQVRAARAAVEQARLELERTTIGAPFDAHILSREVNVGSQVAPGDRLGHLVGVETYWVEATVPIAKLRWITFPGAKGEKGAPVRIHNRGVWPEDTWREGYVDSLIGALDQQTRLARVLVAVPDPLALRPEAAQKPPLIIGTFLDAHIQAEEIADVVRLERDYLRQEDTVWVMNEGKLNIREVDIVFRDARYAYIVTGLQEGEQVVTSNLATVTEGARLRIAGADKAGASQQDPGAADGTGEGE